MVTFDEMKNAWTKETALSELKDLTEYTAHLSERYPFCAEHTRWMARTSTCLEEVFGLRSRYYLAFCAYRWQFKGSFPVYPTQDLDEVVRRRNQHRRSSVRGSAIVLYSDRRSGLGCLSGYVR